MRGAVQLLKEDTWGRGISDREDQRVGIVRVSKVESHQWSRLWSAGSRAGVVQWLSHVRLFVTLWTAACQTSLSFTISRSLLKLMSVESMMPSNHLILCHPFLLLPSVFPSIKVFSNESVLHIRWPTTGVSALAPVLPMNIQD